MLTSAVVQAGQAKAAPDRLTPVAKVSEKRIFFSLAGFIISLLTPVSILTIRPIRSQRNNAQSPALFLHLGTFLKEALGQLDCKSRVSSHELPLA